jgi:WD40 repeat protein
LPVGGTAFPVSAQFTPNGKTLVYSSSDGIRMWDMAPVRPRTPEPTGNLLHDIPREVAGGPSDVLLSLDGKYFFTANDAGIREWEVDTAKLVRSLASNMYSRARLSPDGKLIAAFTAGPPERLEVLQVADGVSLWSKDLGEMTMNGITFSPNGRSVVVDGCASRGSSPLAGNALHFFDARTGMEGKHIDLRGRAPFKVAFSRDGTRLAAVCWGENPAKPMERHLFVFDVTSGEELARIDPPENKVVRGQDYFSALAIAPNGRSLVTAGSSAGLIEWDLESSKELRRFARGTMNAEALAFSEDGKSLAVAGAGAIVRLFDHATGDEFTPNFVNYGSASSRKFSTGKPVVAGKLGRSVLVFQPATGQYLARFSSGNPEQWYLLPPGGGKIPVASEEYSRATDVLRNLRTDERPPGSSGDRDYQFSDTRAIRPNDETIAAGNLGYEFPDWWAVSLDGKTIAAKDYTSDTCHLFDATSGTLLKNLRDPGFVGCRTVLSADGRSLFAFSPDRTARVWDVSAGSLVTRIGPLGDLPPTSTLNGMRVMRDGKFNESWESRGTVAGVGYAATVSPDGSRIAVGDEAGYVNLFDVATAQKVWRYGAAAGIRTNMTFSPDGRNLACCEGNSRDIHILEVATGLQRHTCRVSSWSGRALAFSPDGKILATCGFSEPGACFVELIGRSMHGMGRRGQPPLGMDACWAALARAEVSGPFLPMQELAASEGTVAYLRGRLRPAVLADDKRSISPGDGLRILRAVEVLEWIGDRPARELLEDLARGLPEARLTQDARASLERLKRLEIPTPTGRAGR